MESYMSRSTFRSKPKVVVITGASAGVGRAIAREFGRQKGKIGLIARGKDGLEAAKSEIEEMGGEGLVLSLDVADSEQVDQAAQKVEDTFGPIDVWINNAMVSILSPVKEMTPSEYKRVTDVTYLGYVHGTLAALKRMIPRDEGIIIQISSALAFRSIPLQSAYCAAKHAIAGFTESLRSELFHDKSKVRVTMVNLPAVNTPQFNWMKSRLPNEPQPVPPIFQPEVIAKAVVYASEHNRREINVGFPTLRAIQAEKTVPGLADRYLAIYGYRSQQTDEPVNPHRKDNLWTPLPGDHGAHGKFNLNARTFSLQLLLTTHRVSSLLALASFGYFLFGKRRKVASVEAPVEHRTAS
jgi:short-subunit dehydrogenase